MNTESNVELQPWTRPEALALLREQVITRKRATALTLLGAAVRLDLSIPEALEIRRRYRSGAYDVGRIAGDFGVSPDAVRLVGRATGHEEWEGVDHAAA